MDDLTYNEHLYALDREKTPDEYLELIFRIQRALGHISILAVTPKRGRTRYLREEQSKFARVVRELSEHLDPPYPGKIITYVNPDELVDD